MSELSRRHFLKQAGVATGSLVLSTLFIPVIPAGFAEALKKSADTDEDVSPVEDLMREHGVLERILLIYEACIARLDAQEALNPAHLSDSARVVKHFIEQYHEKLEEDYLFPRFRKANLLVELVDTLESQHQTGRTLTDRILTLVTPATMKEASQQHHLSKTLKQFIRMYRPHAVWEDTVLFPAFKTILSLHEYEALGEQFEAKEVQLFGEDGFSSIVEQIAEIEKALGLYDLAQFTQER
jgi:hemerythrin-like domain-containing protein